MNLLSGPPRVALAVASIAQVLTTGAPAYEVTTHESISGLAAIRSSVGEVLRDSLGLGLGMDTAVDGQVLTRWLRQGAEREDGQTRFFNHFHNPLADDWSRAGLGSGVGQSSILWGQNPGQGLPSWSWQDVRQLYFDALTNGARADRDVRLGRTFEGLGRLVHLVQDAASPGHARDDPHVLYNYETFVDAVLMEDRDTFDGWLGGSPDIPEIPDPGWRSLDGHPLAPVAVARLIDTDRYTGGNPSVTGEGLVGLAEYTNANFFSEDRIFTENDMNPGNRFPHPGRAEVAEGDVDVSVGGATVKRRYFLKAGVDGRVYRLATVGFLKNYHLERGLDWTRFRESPALDEWVYRDYAARLLPRAVAYSTALLDYFFRGGLVAFGDDRSTGIENQSDEPMDGVFALYYDDQNEVRRPVPGAEWTLALPPGDLAEELRFTAPNSPTPKDPGRYLLVFRGVMGSERDAVVGREVTIDSTIFPRLVKRKDGVPFRGVRVQTVDVVTREVVSSGVTDQDGRTRLRWRPGQTALFIPEVTSFPMYWAGGTMFASGLEGARAVQAADLDAEGQVTIAIPIISAEWPEAIEPCTGQPVFAHEPRGFFQESVPVGNGEFDLVVVTYGVSLITFIRSDDGQETMLCGDDSSVCADPSAAFVAEDVNRVDQVVGQLVRSMRSTHFRTLADADGKPIGEPICANDYDEVQVVPVTVVER
jgi:hypothetical protein